MADPTSNGSNPYQSSDDILRRLMADDLSGVPPVINPASTKSAAIYSQNPASASSASDQFANYTSQNAHQQSVLPQTTWAQSNVTQSSNSASFPPANSINNMQNVSQINQGNQASTSISSTEESISYPEIDKQTAHDRHSLNSRYNELKTVVPPVIANYNKPIESSTQSGWGDEGNAAPFNQPEIAITPQPAPAQLSQTNRADEIIANLRQVVDNSQNVNVQPASTNAHTPTIAADQAWNRAYETVSDNDDTIFSMRPIAEQINTKPLVSSEAISEQVAPEQPTSTNNATPATKENAERELEKMISRKELKRGYNLRLFKIFVRDVVVIVVCASILAFILKGFIFSPFAVPSGSMENTLQVGDNIIANKAALWGGIHRGDIVVFKDSEHWLPESIANKDRSEAAANPINAFLKFTGIMPEDDNSFLVKRVIGVPGDHIVSEGNNKPLTINDVEVENEPYVKQSGSSSLLQFDITVPEGKLWVMGDNRNNSADSRYHMNESSKGFVSQSDVVGIVDWIIAPLSRFGAIGSDTEKLRNISTK